jgi:hypothetical protein
LTPAAGLHERSGDQTDDESECCNRLKVEKRFKTDASQAAKIAELGDAGDDRKKDHGSHEHANQLEKSVA